MLRARSAYLRSILLPSAAASAGPSRGELPRLEATVQPYGAKRLLRILGDTVAAYACS